jgi:hypothetical protein
MLLMYVRFRQVSNSAYGQPSNKPILAIATDSKTPEQYLQKLWLLSDQLDNQIEMIIVKCLAAIEDRLKEVQTAKDTFAKLKKESPGTNLF